ncbi:MAG: hypothetical protein DRO98_02405 [Archaeoglobales archaeon]|nr:MAG: hypothetical protein DRO98_02405 [Archaeoglobales archaeon]
MRKLAVVLVLIAALLLLGCAEQVTTPTPTQTPTIQETPTEEEKEVKLIEENISEVENILNDLIELDNINFEV